MTLIQWFEIITRTTYSNPEPKNRWYFLWIGRYKSSWLNSSPKRIWFGSRFALWIFGSFTRPGCHDSRNGTPSLWSSRTIMGSIRVFWWIQWLVHVYWYVVDYCESLVSSASHKLISLIQSSLGTASRLLHSMEPVEDSLLPLYNKD